MSFQLLLSGAVECAQSFVLKMFHFNEDYMSSLQKYALPPRDLQYYANGQNGGDSQAGEFTSFAAR